jgi:restriction endonuclease S subunit
VEILDSQRRPITKSDRKPGPYPYYGATGVLDHVEGFLFDEPLVLVGEDGAKWGPGENSAFPVEGKVWVNNHAHVLRPKRDKIMDRFLIEVLNEADLMSYVTGVTVPKLNQEKLRSIQIPLPPLEIQREIVVEIEGYQKIINGARAVLDNYRPHIPINPDWPMVELGELCVIKSGGTPDRSKEAYWNGEIPWVTTTLIDYGIIKRANEFISSEGLKNSATWIVPKGTVLMAMYGQGVTRGRVAILGIDAAVNQACAVFQIKDNSIDSGYLFRVLQSRYDDLRKVSDARGGNQSNLSAQVLKEYLIPLPPLTEQQAIVAEIEAEQALVNANRELITRFEAKIQTTLSRIWGVEDSFIVAE